MDSKKIFIWQYTETSSIYSENYLIKKHSKALVSYIIHEMENITLSSECNYLLWFENDAS